jgi:hypothetical protein
MLGRSVRAASTIPQAIVALFECMFGTYDVWLHSLSDPVSGASTTLRLRGAGMEFAQWVLTHVRLAGSPALRLL